MGHVDLQPPVSERTSRARRILVVLAALAVAATATGAVLFFRTSERLRLDPGLLAVAPVFVGVAAEGLDTAAASLESALAHRLAAAGTVRVVEPATVRQNWDARGAAAPAAVQLAHRTGAGLVVLAQLWEIGGRDSVRLVARLLDVGNNEVRALAEVRGTSHGLSTLADSAAVLLARELSPRSRPHRPAVESSGAKSP